MKRHTPNRVALILSDYPEWELYCPNFRGMEDGLRTLGIEYQVFSCRPSFDPQPVIDYKPDLVVYGLLDMIKDHESRAILREALPSTKIVMWYGDLRNEETGQIRADASELDMVFVSNAAQRDFYMDHWKAKDVAFLPLGASVVEPVTTDKFSFDFVFVGSSNTSPAFISRALLMERLKKEQDLITINGPENSAHLRAEVFKHVPDIYRSSKLSLDISHFTNIHGYTSNRYWIIPASGGCALTQYFPGCEDFYPHGTRLYFKSYDELVFLKERLLRDDKLRESLRVAGHEHSRNHTYDKRFTQMFSYLFV